MSQPVAQILPRSLRITYFQNDNRLVPNLNPVAVYHVVYCRTLQSVSLGKCRTQDTMVNHEFGTSLMWRFNHSIQGFNLFLCKHIYIYVYIYGSMKLVHIRAYYSLNSGHNFHLNPSTMTMSWGYAIIISTPKPTDSLKNHKTNLDYFFCT